VPRDHPSAICPRALQTPVVGVGLIYEMPAASCSGHLGEFARPSTSRSRERRRLIAPFVLHDHLDDTEDCGPQVGAYGRTPGEAVSLVISSGLKMDESWRYKRSCRIPVDTRDRVALENVEYHVKVSNHDSSNRDFSTAQLRGNRSSLWYKLWRQLRPAKLC
jgi:hypothetical protein